MTTLEVKMSDRDMGREPTEPVGQEPAEMEPTGREPQALDADGIKAELARARKEAAKYRTELRQFQDAEEARKRAAMSATEKLQADYEALQAKIVKAEADRRTAMIRAAVTTAASNAGFVDVEDAMRLLPTEEIELDGDTARGVDDLVANLVANKPYLVKRQGAPSPTNPSSPSRLTLDAVKRMSPQEINANWAAVQDVLSKQ